MRRSKNFEGGVISDISVYKVDTCLVEFEGGGRIYINRSVIEDNSLHKGVEVDADVLESLQAADDRRRAKKRALYLLGNRMYGYNELIKKLSESYSEDISREAADLMRSYGYIDDGEYAAKLAESLIHTKHYGLQKARWEMKCRGLDSDLIEDTLAEYSEEDIDEEILHLLRTKYGERLSDEDGRRRAAAALARRGYGWGEIKHCIEIVTKEGDYEQQD